MPDRWHPLKVNELRREDREASPVLLLEDDLGRTLEIAIGLCEALAIERVLEGQRAVRPLTHDLLLSLAERLEAPVDRVVIDDLSAGTYYARLILNTDDGLVSIDCRPSDGIALALRAHAPIFASDSVMATGDREA